MGHAAIHDSVPLFRHLCLVFLGPAVPHRSLESSPLVAFPTLLSLEVDPEILAALLFDHLPSNPRSIFMRSLQRIVVVDVSVSA
jgi:hypothetical protein